MINIQGGGGLRTFSLFRGVQKYFFHLYPELEMACLLSNAFDFQKDLYIHIKRNNFS